MAEQAIILAASLCGKPKWMTAACSTKQHGLTIVVGSWQLVAPIASQETTGEGGQHCCNSSAVRPHLETIESRHQLALVRPAAGPSCCGLAQRVHDKRLRVGLRAPQHDDLSNAGK